jgi:hypothetical protein
MSASIIQNSSGVLTHTAPASLRIRRWTPARVVVALIAVGMALRLLAASQVGLGNDEGSNYSCSRHLDMSYFDHPPMCAWLGRLGCELMGEIGPVALRLPTILLFAGTTWFVFLIGRRLFGPAPGAHAAALLNLAPVFSITTGINLVPDGPLMFFWIMGVWCLTHVAFQPTPRHATLWWLAVGGCLGLAMLSKYNGGLLVLGTLLFVCTSPGQRRWLWHPGPYLALLLAGAIFSPVLIWNARHGWASFGFQGSRGAAFDGLHWDWLVRSISGQALWLLPWIWILLAGELTWGFCCRTREPRRWFLSCLALPPIAIFTLIALYAPIGLLFHWQCAGYLVLFMAAGDRFHRLLSSSGRSAVLARRGWRFALVASPVIMAALVIHTVTGWGLRLLPATTAERLAPLDPTLEAADYDGLAPFLAERGLLNSRTLVGGSRWFLCGKVDYTLRSQAPVLCLIEPDPRVYAFFHSQRDWLGQDIVLVNQRRYIEEPVTAYRWYFDRIELIGSVPVRRGGRIDRVLDVYRCTHFHTPLKQPYGLTAAEPN